MFVFTICATLHVAQIVNTEQLHTIYPRNMVCFRYIFVNTLHKGDKNYGDNDDDDNNNNNNNNNNSTYSRAGVTDPIKKPRRILRFTSTQVRHKYTQKNKRQITVSKSNWFYKHVYLSTDQVCCFCTYSRRAVV
jgi:hypothetical protein